MHQWLQRLPRIQIRQVIKWLAALLFIPPTVVSVLLVTIDLLRKHTRSQGHFLSLRNEPAVHVDTNEMQLYTYGNDLYTAMLHDIQHAQKRILLETFIWKNDSTGYRFKQALTEAVRRGVEVYVIYDQFANIVVPSSFFQFDPAIHVLCYPFISLPFRPFQMKTYARDHRKVICIDNHISYIGGYNIGDIYAYEWRDTHARVVGIGALEIENSFIDFWNDYKKPHQPRIPDLTTRDWNPNLSVQRNDPMLRMFPIRSAYMETIDRAQKHFYLTNAYFIPDRALLKNLIKAVARGVNVCVLVPAISNHIVADWLSHDFYTACLKSGIRLFLYSHAMIHAKTATADGRWSTIGTANMDRLSMLGNFEVNLEVYSVEVAEQMERIFTKDCLNAHELTPEEWEKRPFYWKIGETLLYTFRPFF